MDEVPLGNAWLVAVSVAPHVIDGAVDRPWVIYVHEGAWTVVNGLARYRHIVGVHDAMNEADELPLRYKRRLARNNQVEERAVPVRGVNRLWVMPRDDVISEAPDRIQIPLRREELEGADTDVARRDAGQYRAGQGVSRQTGSPVVTAASARVVGIPSAAIASLTMYSRRTGPSAARPSPSRENGVGPDPLSWMSRRTPSRSVTSPRRMARPSPS